MRLGNNEAANFSGFRLNIGGYVELATRRAAQRNLIYFIFGLRANCFTFVNALWVFLPLRGSFDLNYTIVWIESCHRSEDTPRPPK